MTAPNMETITASLERSLQNCSLNQQPINGGSDSGIERSSSSDDLPVPENHHRPTSDTTVELNSHLSLPYHWEQCLDLKTGEIYYINWRNGMKAKEDPRVTGEYSGGDYNYNYYCTEDDDDDDEDGSRSSYDSEESSSESSPSCSSKALLERCKNQNQNLTPQQQQQQSVLVVAGCKSCLMYFMVPKSVQDCPKCNGQLLLFDRSGNI